MITLYPMGADDAALLEDSPYSAMTLETMQQMLSASAAKTHNGNYFQLLAVMDGSVCVGFINFCGQGEEISCAPDIKPQFRKRGFGTAAVSLALEYAKTLGYTKAAAQVRQDNTASIALHRKLGFSLVSEFVNRKGQPVYAFEKAIENR